MTAQSRLELLEPLLGYPIWVKWHSRRSCLPHSSPHPQTSLNSSSVPYSVVSGPRRALKCSSGTSLLTNYFCKPRRATSARLGFFLFLHDLEQRQTSHKSSSGSWLPSTLRRHPFRSPVTSCEPRRMLCIRLGSFSALARSFHLFVTSTIPRRVR